MKYLLILAVVFLSSCHRKSTPTPAPSAEKTKTEKVYLQEKAKAMQNYDLKSSPSKKEGIEQTSIKDKLSELDYKSYFESGTAKHNAGDFAGAISDFNKCISLNAEFAEAYNFRGMSKYKSGDKSGACSDWKKATELGYMQSARMTDEYCQ